MKDTFFAILKIFGFLLILPLIIAFFMAFEIQVLSLPLKKAVWIFWGAGTYVTLNLFVYDFKSVYDFGKSLVEKVITFFQPAGYVVPIYSVFLMILYLVALVFGKADAFQPYFLFAIAFTIAMHLVLTAHEIYESDTSILKAHYFLTFGAIFIVSLCIIALLFTWVISEYSLIAFIKSVVAQTSHLYKYVFKTLFIDSAGK